MALIISVNVFAQIGRTYSDNHGGRIFLPYGNISFADQVVYYNSGKPTPSKEDKDPNKALGIPDYNKEKDINFTSLGYGGELVVRFTDNVLYDINGDDLFIFEIGDDETFEVQISKNGKNWLSLGEYGGGTTKIDISKVAKKGDIFRYVKVIDSKDDKGQWPGADIDAIGAIGTTINLSINSSVLFKTGEYTLTGETKELKTIAKKIQESKGDIVIEGYTDNIGTSENNIILSQRRANSVKFFLTDSCNISSSSIMVFAYGETNPVSENNTKKGRQQNRRVEIIIFPQTDTNDVTGLWKTSWGNLHIYKYGDIIAGYYDEDYGEISGKLINEHTIEGIWSENDSSRECKNELYGRNHTGKFIFKFNEDYTKFSATWNYCDDTPNNNDWNGER